MNSKIAEEVGKTVKAALEPVVESSASIEKAENLSKEQKLGLAAIGRNCRSLVDMLNYRSELDHVSDESSEIETAKCDLHKLIKDIDQQFCQRAETQKLFFAVSFAQHQSANNVPQIVEADEQKVRKILEILLGYALAHTNKGRLGLHASPKASEGNKTTVAFEMAYTGNEPKDELLGKVFGTSATGEPDAEDLKYGLSLAQQYVQMMGGEIALEYRNGGITALSIDVPFKTVEAEKAAVGAA